jgi:hypothetical protein
MGWSFMLKILQLVVSALFSLAILISCGGGGSSSNAVSGDDTDAGANINGNLEGKLFIGGFGEGWLLDLQTGRYDRIPGVDWENESGFFAGADFRAYPIAYDGSVILAEIDDCLLDNSERFDCLVRYSDTGDRLGDLFQLPKEIRGVSKLSGDGDYIAFFYDSSFSQNELRLLITDLDLNLVSETYIYDGPYTASSPSLTWLPDNRLAYTFNETIYVLGVALDAGTGDILAQFSAEEGEPRQIAANPDGTKLAFVLQTGGTYRTSRATPWVIDTDGTNRQGLRQLARVKEGSFPSFQFPAWSPDGTRLFIAHGSVKAESPTDLGLLGGGYVIDADSDRILLNDENPDVIQILSYFGMTSGRTDSELTTNLDIREAPVAWIP